MILLKRRTRTVILCGQCGNEFRYGHLVKKNDKDFIVCPYCGYLNKKTYKKKNKKRGNKE